jgi:hypothetical protein
MDTFISYIEWQTILWAKEKENGIMKRKHDTKVRPAHTQHQTQAVMF